MHQEFERCYRAVQARDARFDGWFVTAVRTTGIYCRPSCPARPPLARNVSFFPTAAAAQQAGYRACKRCRPDASPGSPEWNVRSDLVARAMRLIADGTVDREGVGGIASRLGYSTRQLERHLRAEVGAGPLALARSQRAQTARLLVETTDMPMTEVAYGSGFSSIRQFNDTVREVFGCTPSALRARAQPYGAERSPTAWQASPAPGALPFRLPFRRPFEPMGLFGHLAATAVPGCEEHRDGWFRLALTLPGGGGIASLRPEADHVACRLLLDDVRDLPTAIARCRRLLDLDSDPEAVDDVLAGDELLAPWVAKGPGRRLPRCVDGDQLALRVVLAQQVTLASARAQAARVAELYGDPIADPEGGLTRRFPSAARLAEVAPDELRDRAVTGPIRRRTCFVDVVASLAEGRIDLGPGADWARARSDLLAVPGIGAWSAELIAMRGLGDPDALPATDAGVLRGARAVSGGALATASEIERRAERWRPWRSYAVQHLWAADSRPASRWPPSDPTREEPT